MLIDSKKLYTKHTVVSVAYKQSQLVGVRLFHSKTAHVMEANRHTDRQTGRQAGK